MTVAYEGNLTSFMTNPGFEEPLDTPTKLLDKGIKLGMYNYQGSTTLAFGGSSNPEYCQIWGAKEWITSFGDSLKKTIAGKKGVSTLKERNITYSAIVFRRHGLHGLPVVSGGADEHDAN